MSPLVWYASRLYTGWNTGYSYSSFVPLNSSIAVDHFYSLFIKSTPEYSYSACRSNIQHPWNVRYTENSLHLLTMAGISSSLISRMLLSALHDFRCITFLWCGPQKRLIEWQEDLGPWIALSLVDWWGSSRWMTLIHLPRLEWLTDTSHWVGEASLTRFWYH